MSTTTKPRVALWDNARFVLIVLVVVGHLISTVRTNTALGFGLYAYIYLFHMPAMILLSGMFSRADTSPKAIRSTVQLLVTWVAWELLWALIRGTVEGRAPGDAFLVTPAWTLWFLVSLATMRILLPYLARVRHPLTCSIVLALAGGILPVIGTDFSASRTLAFLPFFMAGWLARDRGWLAGEWFVRPSVRTRAAAWAVLGGVAAVFAVLPELRRSWRIDRWLTWRDDYVWLFNNAPVGALQPESWGGMIGAGMLVTAGLMATGAALTLALLVVVPRGASVITVWGTRTLYVYLIHGPIVWVLRETGAISGIGEHGAVGILALTVAGIALALVLSTRWVSRVFRPIVEPRVDWLLGPEFRPAADGSGRA